MPPRRYPDRSLIGALLPAMIARRSSAPAATDVVHIWGFTGTGRPDEANAAGFTEFSATRDTPAAGSPILEIATRMMTGMGGGLWGFGLASLTLAEAVHRDTPRDTGERVGSVCITRPDTPVSGPTAEQVWAATIFDARGREYTHLQYLHLPGLEPITWDDDTMTRPGSWIDRMARGVIAAHVWAAALALDAERNTEVLADIARTLLR